MEPIYSLSSIGLWIVVAINMLLTLALIRRVNTISTSQAQVSVADDTPTGLEKGERAPDFAAETLSDGTASLTTFRGRDVALIFMSPNCQPCKELLPGWEELAQQAQPAGVELVLVSLGGKDETESFFRTRNTGMPVLVAPYDSSPLVKEYKVSRTPFYTLITAEGTIHSTGSPNPRVGEWKTLSAQWKSGVATR